MAYLNNNYDIKRNLNAMYGVQGPKDKTWFVFNEYPFKVLNKKEFNINLADFATNYKGECDISKSFYNSFFRRVDAEKHRLVQSMEYYAFHDDTNNFMIAQNEFNNIEILHPEWLI